MKSIIKTRKKSENKGLSIITGLFAGTINGLFGGGGGMIVVPMLCGFLGYEKKSAHATAILIILPISLTSGLIYGIAGYVDASVLFPVTIGAVAGGVFGAAFLSGIPTKSVAVIFAALMFVAGIKTALF